MNTPIENPLSLKALLNVLHESIETSSPAEIVAACKLIIRAQEMQSAERDVVRCAFKLGPVYDGDVPSKSGRDTLLADGFISKVIVRGEDGFNALTYHGAQVYRLLEAARQ